MTTHVNPLSRLRILVFLAAFCAVRLMAADDTKAPTNAAAGALSNAPLAAEEAAVVSNQSTLRSTLQIQDQLHTLQAEDEKQRRQAADEAALLNQRLDVIENSLASQHVDGLREIQHSNDMVLVAAGAFACFGFLVLILASILQWQMVNRIRALAAAVPSMQGLPPNGEAAALGVGAAPLLGSTVSGPTAEFLGAIERLERRIHEMETGATTHQALAEGSPANGASAGMADEPAPEVAALLSDGSDKAKTIAVLLIRGQTQLKLDQPDAALASFDEILAQDPSHTDAMLKRGAALERLQRLNEAIECYDRAIATDSTMTMAYLHKGGVFNRMERYSEALECYEQALKSQEKAHPAEVVVG